MLTLTVDVAGADKLCAAAQRQLPYATSRAVNQVANDVRDTMRDELLMRFIVRKRGFMQKQIQVHRYSDKKDPVIYAEVGTGMRDAAGKVIDILGKFEEGGTKTALDPTNPIAIPSVNIRKRPEASVSLDLYPKNLRLVPRKGVVGIMPAMKHVTKRGVVQLQGKRRTFVLDPATMFGVKTWGVYQRTGKRTVRLIWTYKSRIPIPARLGLRGTALSVVEARWPAAFARFFEHALATAR